MDSNLFYILILIGLLFIIIGALSGAVIYLLLRKNNSPFEHSPKPDQIKDLENEQSTFCLNHKDKNSKGSCGICEESFCETCLKEWDGLNFCSKHLKLFSENSWIDITDIKTTPEQPEAATYLYKFKRREWKENKTPSYIVTHYKINFEGDFIESYVKLYVRSQDQENIRNKLNEIN